MNTPTHVMVSALALGRGRWRAHWLAITAGAVAPDLSMVCLYVYGRVVRGTPERLAVHHDIRINEHHDVAPGLARGEVARPCGVEPFAAAHDADRGASLQCSGTMVRIIVTGHPSPRRPGGPGWRWTAAQERALFLLN